MQHMRPDSISTRFEAAQVVLPADDLEATLAFFTDRLGFRIETIRPADQPSVVVISGYGVRLETAIGVRSPVCSQRKPLTQTTT